MENPGAVSLWFGNCSNSDMLSKYVEIKYDENGDRIQSSFLNDFQIDFIDYNQDLLECTYIENPTSSLSELLKNASYSDSIIIEIEEFYGKTLKYRCKTRYFKWKWRLI